jgi:quinol monooxygenase YgiN
MVGRRSLRCRRGRRRAGTVQYRWFSTGDPLRLVVFEEYTDLSGIP